MHDFSFLSWKTRDAVQNKWTLLVPYKRTNIYVDKPALSVRDIFAYFETLPVALYHGYNFVEELEDTL
jgi:hypothetical protein